ncbi:N-acetyl-gamma-glutamyl-phosphate reductase [Cellulosimicrobium sp. Marseille-Q4280]|uniref:N-acetyl-gamma-glutamyl-phosphate reductase n=1 Tax=Cellulosimicrobium sp. Marseille-Q4280 TaxID=2937992 RepID=UPI00203FA5E6|nr:N-acetyl-gamma-glutamyl-phosphate reductase [Cellulosimicrobium sp. Marseille-Q4280]
MHMTITVAVAGASGYAGGEMLRLLAGHPDVEIGAVTAHSNAGTLLGAHQPHLRSLADRVLLPTTLEHLVGHDVVVLALPHGASGEISAQLPDDVLVLDLGADHRLESAADWAQFYGSEHAGTWPYGLPELLLTQDPGAGATETRQRERLAGARRIAVPGCNVTAVTLGLQPGVAAGVVDPRDVVAVLANGYSGAGKALKPHLLASEGLGSAQPYAVGGGHRHIPEIVQNLRAAGAPAVRISFTPTLVPMARGILATVSAPLADAVAGLGPAELDARVRQAWDDAYVGEPFVQVLPEGQWPSTAMTLGANTALIQVAVDHAAGRVVTVTAIDNLVKGTAGAAVQSMNIALGLPQTAGLTTEGVAP